ncbi:hypothetical protein DPX39_070021500 [Trypanosoma brucei equiperdum]|uniref:Uncharacterized protein n=1 Tax=Trypanosoma brucei equiperdum TaxID=630700 RepID=A0A3L6L4Y0_9TRYP|nr:hypothetical protein DPX39_070021500 [Trypanosoma brucei equiperdum]
MKVAGSILALLRNRLPTAPLHPVTAAELLCELHPSEDRVVSAHLVGCVEGNGVLLSLPVLLGLIRRGYSDSLKSFGSSALSQWGPMEETIFTALWVQLRSQRESLVEVGSGPDATDGICESEAQVSAPERLHADSCLLIERMMLLMISLGKFVLHSTLTLKGVRLQLLAEALSPLCDAVESAWCRMAEARNAGEIPSERLLDISKLVARCIHIYGKYFAAYHHIFCAILFTGVEASRKLLEAQLPLTDRETLARVRSARDVLLEVKPLLTGLLVRASSRETQRYVTEVEEWLEMIVSLVETPVLKAVGLQLRSHICSLGSSGNVDNSEILGAELRNCYIVMMHTAAVLLAMRFHRNQFFEECNFCVRANNLIARGLKTIWWMLDTITMSMGSPNKAVELQDLHSEDSVTWCEWGNCCEVAEVVRRFFPLYSNDARVSKMALTNPYFCVSHHPPVSEITSVLLRILRAACHRLARSVAGDGDLQCSTVPFVVFLQIVRAALSWGDACREDGGLSPSFIWSTIRATLPRQLHASSPPLWTVLMLLEDLGASAYFCAYHCRVKLSIEDRTVVDAMKEMCDNCLAYLNKRYLCDDDLADADVICRVLHTLAALKTRERDQSTLFGGDLFFRHSTLMNHLRKQLVPLDQGVLRRSGGSSTSSSRTGINNLAGDPQGGDFHGGAYWFICSACETNILWQKGTASISSPSSCHCWMRRNDPVEAVVACIELFLPLLGQEDRVGDHEHFMEDAYPTLRSVYNAAIRSYCTTTPLCGTLGSDELFSSDCALPSKYGTGSERQPLAPTAFLVECHQYLLLLYPTAIQPQHAYRILRVMLTTSPLLFAHTPQLARFLFRCLIPVERGRSTSAHDFIESCDPQELWQVLLCACATQVACAGCKTSSNNVRRDEGGKVPIIPSSIWSEDAEIVFGVLYDVGNSDVGDNDTFLTIRGHVVRRAMEILHAQGL